MTMDINSAIPTGEWSLYFHSPREKKWSLDTYSLITTVSTWDDMFAVTNELGDAKLKGGMFFWMRAGIPPLWENHQNIRGGSYSLRGSTETGLDIFMKYSIGAMLGNISEDPTDTILGVSISPKLVDKGAQSGVGFYVIKIWNQDCTKFSVPQGIKLLDAKLTHAEIMYVPHNEKKM